MLGDKNMDKSQKSSEPVRRTRLRKKSMRNLDPSDISKAAARENASNSNNGHQRQMSTHRLEQMAKVEIIPSMSSAGIPRPARIPSIYRNDAKLMSLVNPNVNPDGNNNTLRANSMMSNRTNSMSGPPANGARVPLPPLDYCIRKTSLRVTQGMPQTRSSLSNRCNSTLTVRIPEVNHPRILKPVASSSAHQRSVSMSAISQRPKPMHTRSVSFEPLPEEDDKEEKIRSSASSCYSRTSSQSGDLDIVRPVIASNSENKARDLYPVLTPPDFSSNDINTISFLNLDSISKRHSGDSLIDLYDRSLPVIPSEPESRADSMFLETKNKEPVTSIQRRQSIRQNQTPNESAKGVLRNTRASTSLDQACQQLEDQLQAVSNRLKANHRQTQPSSSTGTGFEHEIQPSANRQNSYHSNESNSPNISNQQRPQHSTSPSSSSVSSSGSSASEASTVYTPVTEFSPISAKSSMTSSQTKPSGLALKRSSSLLCMLDNVANEYENQADTEDNEEDEEEDEDVNIDAAAASNVIHLILASLPDLSSLFSAALISKGFYQVFKRREQDLIQAVIRKMSPALWELCEVSKAKDHFLTPDYDRARSASQLKSPATLYLRGYDHAMYTVVALKAMIAERCRGLLREDQILHFLSEANEERAVRIDTAIWRVWTFCAKFGCRSGREGDIAAQKSWLNGQASRSKKQSKVGGYALTRSELEDVLEVWNALFCLLQSLELRVIDAENVGLFEGCSLDHQSQKSIIQEWFYHIMSLGPRVVLDLASTWPSTSYAILQKAKAKGWTQWKTPTQGHSMALFFHEAATRLHVEKVLAETRDIKIVLPGRAAGRGLGAEDRRPGIHRKTQSDSHARPSATDIIFPSHDLTQNRLPSTPLPPSSPSPRISRGVTPQRRYGMLGSSILPSQAKLLETAIDNKDPKNLDADISQHHLVPEGAVSAKSSDRPGTASTTSTKTSLSDKPNATVASSTASQSTSSTSSSSSSRKFRWEVFSAGPESPAMVVHARSRSASVQSSSITRPETGVLFGRQSKLLNNNSNNNTTSNSRWVHPAMRAGSMTSAISRPGPFSDRAYHSPSLSSASAVTTTTTTTTSASSTISASSSSPLIEYGESRYALPYSGTKQMQPPVIVGEANSNSNSSISNGKATPTPTPTNNSNNTPTPLSVAATAANLRAMSLSSSVSRPSTKPLTERPKTLTFSSRRNASTASSTTATSPRMTVQEIRKQGYCGFQPVVGVGVGMI